MIDWRGLARRIRRYGDPVEGLARTLVRRGVGGQSIARSDVGRWRDAIYRLFDRGAFDAAGYGADLLMAAHPDVQVVRTIHRLLAVLPPAPTTPFTDDPSKELQIARRANATTVILAFADVNHTLGLPFMAAHRWLGQGDASIVYLRDRSDLWFVSGMRSVGGTFDATLARLRDVIAGLGARRVVCYGNSSGGFAAIQYGAALGAEAVASMAGPTDLAHLRSEKFQHLARSATIVDLRVALARPDAPRVIVVCAEGNWDDRIQADNIAGLPNVKIQLVEGFDGHAVAVELMCREQFDGPMRWLGVVAAPLRPAAPAKI